MSPGAREFDTLDAAALERGSPVPLYFQVAQRIEADIESGRLTPGARLPNETELADRLGLSRPTMRRAMQHLVDKGLIVRRRGVGTRVVSPKVRRSLELTSLHDDLAATGQSPTTTVLAHQVRTADDDLAARLGVTPGAAVLELVRLRSAQGEPIARLTNYLPAERAHLDPGALADTGLYQLLRRAGIQLHSATQVIGARTATAAEARLLGERRNAAVLTMQRTAFDDHGTIVEYGDHIYSAARYSFSLDLLVGT